MDNRIIFSIIGAIAGFIICYMFFFPDITERVEYSEKIQIDTVYQEVRDTIRIDHHSVKTVYLRDTIIQERSFPINRFSGLESTLYGDIGYSGLVAGHFLNLDLTTNFKIPQITNTIERETIRTRTINPKGLYLGGSVSDQVQFSAGASYLDNKWMFDYRYDRGIQSHSIGVKRKIF
jgi:hypothetical protein